MNTEDVEFLTKPQIAIAQLREALERGVTPGIVLADAGYGVDNAFREAADDLDLEYVVGVKGNMMLWPPGVKPLPHRDRGAPRDTTPPTPPGIRVRTMAVQIS